MKYNLPVKQFNATMNIGHGSPEKEAALVNDWLRYKPGQRLHSVDGQPIMVIDPGHRNNHEGPDISDACLFINGRIHKGPVECHLKAQHWFQHGHDHDPNYQTVILQVLRHFPTRIAVRSFPMIVIQARDHFGSSCLQDTDCLVPEPETVLRRLGYRRWRAKIADFQTVLASTARFLPKLQQSVFEVLGYGGNRPAFGRLAGLVNPNAIPGKSIKSIHDHLATLMKSEGLIWHRCGVRPANHPENRLPLAARLLKFIADWEKADWGGREVFDQLWLTRIKPHAGLGIQIELLGNVFYPVLAARARENMDLEEVQSYREHWSKLFLPYIYGFISRRFRILMPVKQLRNFPVTQGIIELNKQFCQPEHCLVCPLKVIHGNT